ncbi:iron chaperone [Leptospira sp. WS39.C2]
MKVKTPSNIDEYIQTFPEEIQNILSKVREIIKEEVPNAKEAIRYAIPTFIQNGNIVHFAAFKSHLGFYALPSGNLKFQKEISKYKIGKGSIQFPFNEPLPIELIRKIVKFRAKENENKIKLKDQKKKTSKTKKPISKKF